MKRWQRVAGLAQAVRHMEKRIEQVKETGREPDFMLVRIAEELHARLARERLAWEGVKGA